MTRYFAALGFFLGLLFVYGLMGNDEYNEQVRAEAHLRETIQAAKAEFERRRRQHLIDDANQMIFPVSQIDNKWEQQK